MQRTTFGLAHMIRQCHDANQTLTMQHRCRYELFKEALARVRRNVIYNVYQFTPARLSPQARPLCRVPAACSPLARQLPAARFWRLAPIVVPCCVSLCNHACHTLPDVLQCG